MKALSHYALDTFLLVADASHWLSLFCIKVEDAEVKVSQRQRRAISAIEQREDKCSRGRRRITTLMLQQVDLSHGSDDQVDIGIPHIVVCARCDRDLQIDATTSACGANIGVVDRLWVS